VVLVLILWLYTVEVIICTLALSFELREMPIAVVDLDRTPASRRLADRFAVTEAFEPVAWLDSAAAAEGALQAGRARLALVVPRGFQQALDRSEAAPVQVLIDATNSNVAAQARIYALAIAARFGGGSAGEGGAGALPVLRVWYNPDQSYTSFMVLSMIATAALMVGVIYPAASIVREREVGTIEQLRVTLIRTPELFVAKTLPTLLIGVLAVFPGLLIAWWFGVPLRGSLSLFLALTAVFLLSAIAIGVLVAAVSRTLQQALLLSFFGLFPLMFLSGTLAPVESMPEILQTISLASPLRHYMDIILGIFLKGAGVLDLWPQALSLAAIGAPLFLLAGLLFERRNA
jgi:ABC-2 type transport system permease protein